jgi:membrane associated rhomboid family serine protease
MFIVGDQSHHNGRFPWVTGSLIFINLLAFCAQCFLGEKLTNGFSLVPYEITEFTDLVQAERIKVKVPADLYYDEATKQVRTGYGHEYVTIYHYHGPFPIILTLLTSMFLHGDWLHLVGNMWFLGVFGRNVECALDHGRFLWFYLACGIAGGLAHVFSDMSSVIPCLGASGAISGVMGAYVAIYPFNTVRIWFGWAIGVVELPALVVVGAWFLIQYLLAFATLETGVSDGVAYWDHLGGFAAGIGIVWATFFYLKHQEGQKPQPAEEAVEVVQEAPIPVEEAIPDKADPFAMFLASPAAKAQAAARKRTATPTDKP